MIIDAGNLAHYGTKRHSGRYPWGSGEDEVGGEHSAFLKYIKDLKKQGLKNPEIATALGIGTTDKDGNFRPSTGQLRAQITIANAEKKQLERAEAQKLKDKGMHNAAIAERMGVSGESYVRGLLAEGAADRADALMSTADLLKQRVDEDKFIDIGKGQEHYLGIAQTRLTASVAVLKEKGYEVHTVKIPQLGTGFETQTKVLCPPGTTWGEVMKNRSQIKPVQAFSDDGGHTFVKIQEPLSIHPDRVGIVYKEAGGDKADGVIYVRRGVDDVSLGGTPYAQVRIKVGDSHYLKGMAMYKDDMPKGVDLLFNADKTSTGNKLDAMKGITDDPDLPFGSIVRQITNKEGKVTSVMNKVGMKEGAGEEGGWDTWSNSISSQVLSKQSPSLAKAQLNVTFERRKNEYDDIMALTNPTVKKKLLEDFAKSTDSAAVHLRAASLPRQATKVILPVNSMKPNEVYAPGFKSGETVVLIRFPHGGIFEIPELRVNNRNPEAKNLLGDAVDAIGIHHSVAKHLSGADFDGDTVLVIPNPVGKIKHSPALDQLKDFDPRRSYPPYHGMKTIDGGVYDATLKKAVFEGKKVRSGKGSEMGGVSNLITDMTLQQASHEHIARAVKHSMVVIDAEKHHLDYRRSAIEQGIPALKAQYQGGPRAGASTLISIKKRTDLVPERKPRPVKEGGKIDETGRRMFVETGRTRVTITGERVRKMEKVNLLDVADDARRFSSGTPMEKLYADHSNRLKALANQSRLSASKTPRLVSSKSAKNAYSKEVASLKEKLTLAERNAPRERQAQIIAKASVDAKRALNPHLEDDQLRKIRWQEQERARARLGARKQKIVPTQEEWNAIQAGAVTDSFLSKVLANADMAAVRALATPPKAQLMTANKKARAQDMLALGYPRAEVAEALGVSESTLRTALNG